MIEGTPGTAFEGEVTVRRIRFAGEDGGFAVLDAERDGDELVLVGPIAHLEERERARIRGTWQDDRRFGMQIRVATAEPLAPSGDAALLAYLKRVKHVGDGRAKQLLARHGPDVLEAIDADPHGALRAVGLNPRRTNEAVRSWHGLRSSRALHLQLAPHGLAWLVPRITKEHGERAHLVVRERPYELTSVFGVGFRIADAIARAGGIAADAPARTRAAVVHVLAEAERDGSTCLPVAELATRAAALLDGPPPDAALLGAMADDGQLVVEVDDEAWAYRPATWALEAELAQRIGELAAAKAVLKPPGTVRDEELEPAPEQGAAVAAAFAHRLSVVTGGPGTGKTATIRLLVAAAKAQRAKVALVAPTGRAARRMTESTAAEATTIHAALGWIPGQGPTVDAIDARLLIVDETSMANLELLVTLLRAVGGRTHVVLVGDADQLAPVGAGKPFADLVAARAVPVAELTHIFRQAAGSMIVRGAHAVRHGEPPSFRAEEGMRRDLFLIARDDPRAALAEIVSLVAGAPARVLRDRPRPRHPGLRARLPRRARDRRAQRAPARGAQPRREAGARRPPAARRQADALRPQPARARAHERHRAAAARVLREVRDAARRGGRDHRRAAGGGGAAARARLRLLGPQGPGDRAAGRDRRRPRGRGRVLPAPRDALHGDDARPDGDARRRPGARRGAGRGDAGHLAPPLAARRAAHSPLSVSATRNASPRR